MTSNISFLHINDFKKFKISKVLNPVSDFNEFCFGKNRIFYWTETNLKKSRQNDKYLPVSFMNINYKSKVSF